MISNNTSNKLKASRSSRDFRESKVEDTIEEKVNRYSNPRVRCETIENAKESNNSGNNARVMVFSPRGKTRGLLEFRPGHSDHYDRRPSSGRGKNIYNSRRDRDYFDGREKLFGRKFQEPLKGATSENSNTSHHPKPYYDDKIKNDFGYHNLPEDPRISKMLRKLSIESDQEKSIAICHKLLDTLMLPDNAKYIRRAFDILADSIIDIMVFGPCDETKQLAARALGRIGYIMENDFKYFLTRLTKEFSKCRDDDTKILLMKSLLETYALEQKSSKLFEFSSFAVNNVINQVEYAEKPELFMVLIDVVLAITECYPEMSTHFRDVVDILVGWLIESNHSPEMADYASKSLQRLGVHWQSNIGFSIQLLAQFLEDLVSFSEALTSSSSGSSTPLEYMSSKVETSLNQVTALTRVINTILKCLDHCLNPATSSCISHQFLTDCFINITSTANKTLEKYLPENLIVAANESAYILLGYMQQKSTQANDFLYNLIDCELSLTQEFSDATVVSMLLLISRTVKEVSANLPTELIQKLLGPQSEILKLRSSHSIKVQNGVVSIYHSLLNLKNIPLLQEAYRYILGDLERSISILIPSVNDLCNQNPLSELTYEHSEAEIVTLFLLRCLSDLANASSSIIGMWALKPSILELLAVKICPCDAELSLRAPNLQYAIFYLLYSHCKRYSHFVTSSNLVFNVRANVCDILGLPLNLNLGEGATSSPTSGHLTIILGVLTKALNIKTSVETKNLILIWSKEIIHLSEAYHSKLYQKVQFMDFLEAIVESGYESNYDILICIHEIVENIISKNNIKWPNKFLISVLSLCALHACSIDEKIKQIYTDLIRKVPWNLSITELMKTYSMSSIKKNFHNQLSKYNSDTILLAQHLHINRGTFGEIQNQNFRKFMAYLLFGAKHETTWLENIFNCSWPIETTECEEYVPAFGELALNSETLLLFWITWEAAQFCVNNKLRTPLGKPTDTFTSIEGAIKKLARESTGNVEVKTECGGREVSMRIGELKRARSLLEFMEHLEKVIYNASEGCASAMSQPSKPVRTFFHTNASTCREWLSRIRTAIIMVALHTGKNAIVLRHGQALLKDLVTANNLKGDEFERAILCLTWAYLNLNDPESIQGLYSWCNNEAKCKFPWLKSVAEEASRKYENAALSYESILENEIKMPSVDEITEKNKNEPQNQIISFLTDRITECYKNVSSWLDLEKWKEKEHAIISEHNQNGSPVCKYSVNRFSNDYAKCLVNFEENDFIFTDELAKWNLDSSRYKNECDWSVYSLYEDIHTNLFSVAIDIVKPEIDNEKLRTKLDETVEIIHSNIQDELKSKSNENMEQLLLMNYVVSDLKELLNNGNYCSLLKNYDIENEKYMFKTSIFSKIVWWSEYFSHVRFTDTENELSNMRLDLAKISRKEGNLNLARKQVQKYFHLKKDLTLLSEIHGYQWRSLENIGQCLIENSNLDVNLWTVNNTRAVIETAKLLHVNNDNKELALNLCAVASFSISQRLILPDSSYDLREKGTKLLLTLGKWIQSDSNHSLINELNSPLGRLVLILPEIGLVENNNTDIIPRLDMAVGKLYQFAVNQCPSLAKAWFCFGSWCYRWGHKLVDYSSESGGQLSDNDRLAIQNLMPIGTSVEDLQCVYHILSQTRAVTDDDDIESNEIKTSEMIETQLRSVEVLSNAYPEHLNLLVEIWRQAQKRVYSLYEISAESYFKYLQLYSSPESDVSNDCNTTIATLRLLRLIVKHALELQSVLEAGLSSTPTRPWKVIIAQLFSRLNHPEAYVRHRVSDLLCRVAEDAPHLITFPAVVGAADGGCKLKLAEIALPKDYLSQTNAGDQSDEKYETDIENKEETTGLNACLMSMVETLSKQAPEAIMQVQLLVKELRRITLLWDELWLGTLLQHNSEIARRFTQLEQEIQKVNNNANLSKDEKSQLIIEKHRIMIKPIIFILEQLNAITSVDPETPNEKLFQERFGEIVNDVLDKLKNPINPEKTKESWQPLRVLQSKLHQRAHKRASYNLKMSDISPTLANMRNTLIAMPGLANNSKKIITIRAFDNHVSILPTKTKPKKLIFHGSDGRTYTYLFKGLEDLHLDERIMQFLSIANTMLAKSLNNTNQNMYRARHYSVIPLGPRSGLISWVDGVIPVFSLYKRWQQREPLKANLKQNNSCEATVVLRPSELFYNKLKPLLKEHNVKNLDNRKEWPVTVLTQVLTELMSETPDDLLAKELWCHSINTSSWWQVVRNYSHSVAVMSIIGYIIGLGDRHLDNMLVDLASGEVVHIDYNVCFEKGKTLRVPERVPFRMTQNIKAALGLTGIEGMFRLTCEHVLRTLKKGRETLLTLLEAFVYDPLVDWTVGGDSTVGGDGSSRRELEREVTAAMFCVRCAEMRADWLANRDELLKQIPVVIKLLEKWQKEEHNIKLAKESLQDLHQQMAMVKEAEAHASTGKHTLFTLSVRYAAYKKTYDTFNLAKKSLEDKIEDCEKHISLHNTALNTIRGSQLSQWIQELNFPIDHENHKVFDLVKDFLQNAGQSSMIANCEQSEKELGQLAQQQNIFIRTCLDLLNQYAAVASNYPSSYIEKHRSICYIKWFKYLLETKSVEACHEVLAQFESLFGPENANNPLVQQVISYSYQLQTILNESNIKLKNSYDRLSLEGISDTGSQFDKAYNDAKSSISNFLRNEKGAAKAFECVNITALCALNKRYLMMEQAAASAADCLVDLHSREGDWFLDEMHLMNCLVTEFSSLIPLQHNSANKTEDNRVTVILNCLKTANNIYRGLQELNFNFHTIILPEAIKTIQTEEVSVLAMIQQLNDIVQNIGIPLPKLLTQLEMHLRFTIMEMDSPHSSVQVIVTQLRTQYESLLHSQPDLGPSDQLTSGKMLLMGFNGLFDNLNIEFNTLISALSSLDIPTCWKKVDQFREAKDLSAPIFNESTRSVLDDIFLIKRIQTVTEFFTLCNQSSVAFKGVGLATLYDDTHLNKPIKRFTADYVSRQLLGVTSQTIALALCLLLQRMGLNVTNEIEQKDIGAENKVPLEELCKKLVDTNLKRGTFTSNTLAQASGLSSTLETAGRRREVARHLQHNVEIQRATLQRVQLQLTAHHWLHEDIIALQPALAALSPLMRSTFMLELRKASSGLLSMQSRLTEAQEQQRALVSSAEQRLKWAAGANPALGEIMAAFECAAKIRDDRLAVEQKLAVQVGNTCNALLHHEALRTRTSEGISHDTGFISLINQWEQACSMLSQCTTTISPAEETLMQLLPTKEMIDSNWIRNASVLISNMIETHQQHMVLQSENLYIIKDCLDSEISKLKGIWDAHHHLMGDIRNLLKSMAKSEECSIVGLQIYLKKYYLYSETLSGAFYTLKNEDLSSGNIQKMIIDFKEVEKNTNSVYEELMNLEVNQNSGGGNQSKAKRAPLVRQETVWQSPSRTTGSNRGGQQRNRYAVDVWRRVRMKLEGRDPDPGRKYSLQEQVDYVIREATNIENLALLYEGWTPWV